MHNCKNRHCWYNQHFHHTDCDLQNTRRYLVGQIIVNISINVYKVSCYHLQKHEQFQKRFNENNMSLNVTFTEFLNDCTLTITSSTISSESLFTNAHVRSVTVGAVSVFITWTGIRRTVIDICSFGKEEN